MRPSLLSFLAGGAVGYVLGARAGRQRYEQIAGTARAIAENPAVRSTASAVGGKASEGAAAAGSKLTDVARSTADRARRRGDDELGLPTPEDVGATIRPVGAEG